MIKITSIRKSITILLKKVEDVDVFFTNVSKTDFNDEQSITKYFHVSLIPISTSLFGKLTRDRDFFIDIAYINDNADTNLFYEWYEKMNEVFLPYIQIEDRSITIETLSMKIVSEIGHCTFTLKFNDVIDYQPEGELAQDLHITINEEEK